ncbi:MAG: 50S ribosomal protein L31 [Nitrososphaeria archaeon]|nr:50S ribosomal protein L31 [Nitrosopumilaceae archaeon]NIP09012.1 50S ribosomal protein L31 [Nitrosopumilaceae archaeon]NIP91382.1 50S ribosomal protein L31 [Nitrososphaeria archaeon]NIS95208.1 50S ribosomal protein L31 [Nitrosopumilaceae archaeon]
MSQELERVHTINLGKALLSVDTHRATRAINMIKEYARRHMKVEEIKIEEDLAQQIWARGARHPPRKIRVRMSKTDEGYILVSRFDEDAEAEIAPETETKKVEEKVAPEAEEAELKEPEAEEAELKEPEAEEPAKEEAELKEPEKEEKKESKK